jgi:hypothetical protein
MPNLNSMWEFKNVRENILREENHKEADHLLIPGDPSVIGSIRDNNLLLILVFSTKELKRSQIRPLKETHDPCTAKRGQNLGLLTLVAFASEIPGRWRTDDGCGRWIRGRRQ